MTTQNQFAARAKSRFSRLPIDAQLFIYLVALVVIGAIIFAFFGRPLLDWGDRLGEAFGGIFMIPIVAGLLTLPYWVAVARHVDARIAIFVLMVISVPFDLIGIGEAIWVGCLVWALAAKNSKVAYEDNIAAVRAAQAATPVNFALNASPVPPAIPQSPADAHTNVVAQLKGLSALRDQGILTEEEFAIQKSRLLS